MVPITKHKLGQDGPQVPCMGFGLMGLSIAYGATESTEERLKVLDRAYELGETFWDSADIYGDSEELVGEWFKRTGKRNEIFLATKFALTLDDKGGMTIRSDPEYVKAACNKSLGRLGVDSIDLYYMNLPKAGRWQDSSREDRRSDGGVEERRKDQVSRSQRSLLSNSASCACRPSNYRCPD